MSTELSTPFDYSALGHNEQVIKGITTRIAATMRTLAQSVFAIGRELNSAKGLLGGRFLEWANAEFGFSERTCRNYCAVAKQLGQYEDRMSTMPPSTLYVLASKTVPEEAIEIAIARSESGKTVTADDTRAMVDETRGRNAMAAETDVDSLDDEPEADDRPANTTATVAAEPADETSLYSDKWSFDCDCLDGLGVEPIDRQAIAEELERLIAKAGPTMNRILVLLRSLYAETAESLFRRRNPPQAWNEVRSLSHALSELEGFVFFENHPEAAK